MTQEEKAKRYDEALEKAKNTIEVNQTIPNIVECVESLFPELAESEDEKIRKEIINYFECQSRDEPTRKYIHDKWIAWLKKQTSNADNVNKEYWRGYREGKQEILDKYAELKKQGEQNLANSAKTCKVEPKPNPCDGCVNRKGCINCENGELRETEQKSTAWSEDDEKILDLIIARLHSHPNVEAEEYGKDYHWLKSLKDRVQPQPKQEWKQENTGDLTDFENAMMHIGGSFFGQHAGLDPNSTDDVKEQAELLLSLVPKQEWSEEDEKMLGYALDMIEWYSGKNEDKSRLVSNWLNSLKDRCSWKPNDKQIEALESATENCAYSEYQDCLRKLIRTLKKLRRNKL